MKYYTDIIKNIGYLSVGGVLLALGIILLSTVIAGVLWLLMLIGS